MLALKLHPQFLVDANGERSLVVLSRAEYEQILEVLEDLEDVRLSRDRLVAEGDQAIPWDTVRAEPGSD